MQAADSTQNAMQVSLDACIVFILTYIYLKQVFMKELYLLLIVISACKK